MRLDHLLSKEEMLSFVWKNPVKTEERSRGFLLLSIVGLSSNLKHFGGDAFRGNTRSHPEHDGKDLNGRWYCTGDGVGE